MTLRSCFWWMPSLYSIADCMFKWPKGFHAPTLRRKAIPQWTATITEITFEIIYVSNWTFSLFSESLQLYLFVRSLHSKNFNVLTYDMICFSSFITGISVLCIWLWPKCCLCCWCWRWENQYLLCRRWLGHP